jgi:hypothetical protein
LPKALVLRSLGTRLAVIAAMSALRKLFLATSIALAAFLSSSLPVAWSKDKPPPLRWVEGQPGCTFSRDDDGKYRYALWTDNYGIILAVDSQELDKVRHRIEPFFSVHITVRYRGNQTLEVDAARATLEFIKHFKLVQSSLDPEGFASQTQNDADELEFQTERDVKKHPERKEEREKYLQTYQKEVAEFLDFLTQRSFPMTELNPSQPEISGWVLFSTRNKWLGEWKKPEEFLLRFPIADQIVEFPFELPPQKGDLILRKRTP